MAQAHEEQRSPAGGGGQLSAAVEEQQQQAGLRVLSSSSSSLSSKPLNTPETKPQNTSIGTAHPQLTSPSTFTASGHSDKSPAARTKENSSLDPDPPQQSLSHRPSITFSSASSMDRRRARRVPADGDGSADETVPIISREQGGHARDYQSISPQIRAKHAGGTAIPGNGVNRERQEREAEAAAVAAEAKEGRWWKKVIEKYGSVELENKGSVARDHLALERTFLAWLRTSLSFASIGIAITQLFRLNTAIASSNPPSATESPRAKLRHVGKPLGATFIAISILILFIGFHRYFESQHYVIRGKFPASRGSILVVSVVAGALIVASLVVVLAIAPGAFEK